jgi:hypothetical protein
MMMADEKRKRDSRERNRVSAMRSRMTVGFLVEAGMEALQHPARRLARCIGVPADARLWR